jgi:hypothetical protein
MGNVVPGYRVRATLHAGRRVTVARAMRDGDDHPVVLKILADPAARPHDAAALRREFDLLRRVRHPGVAAPLDTIAWNDGFALVMDDIGGESLDAVCGRGPMAVGDFLPLAAGMAEALAAVHGSGMVHKDVCPANFVWNAASGAINLIDFRIASELAREYPSGDIEGDLRYIAPERSGRVNRLVDHRSDYYSLGATFYHLLTGRPPFEAEDPLDLLHCHIARSHVAAHRANEAVPETLSAILGSLLAKDPEDRYQSAWGLRTDLEDCREHWRAGGTVPGFAVGMRDRRAVLRIPQILYGREAQFDLLLDSFRRVAGGGHELLLVSGDSGVGKSALVNELRRPVAERRGLFLDNKFEVQRRNVPYAPMIHAFGALFRRIATHGGARARDWSRRLAEALGDQAAVVAAVIPDIEALLGPPPQVPALGPAEAQNRFLYVFGKMVGVLARAQQPLVLFFDDLQWADLSSLRLIEALARDPTLSHLLVIGAWRDGETPDDHPLRAMIAGLAAAGARPAEVRLAGLEESATARLLADTLAAPYAEAAPLARLLHAATHGNPFLLGHRLETLERLGLLAYAHGSGRWTWDLVAIAGRLMDGDQADILAERASRFPSATLDLLRLAACIGNQFDLGLLAAAAGMGESEAARLLWPALEAALVLPMGGDPSVRLTYRFAHDRVAQAAYAQFDREQAMRCHLAIGRALRARAAGEDVLFDLVHQLNRASPLLAAGEREDLAGLRVCARTTESSSGTLIASSRHWECDGLESCTRC